MLGTAGETGVEQEVIWVTEGHLPQPMGIIQSLSQGSHVVTVQGRVRGMRRGLFLSFCIRWLMTLSEVRKQKKFNNDVPSAPQDPPYPEAM